ncbi:tyrosine-type recombinase/integrase [Limisalsivibrio acetivorans]|uniref:tyrosine-type recombinase/integrase n=1 Tax=Limisalsivibrio acetivorans TaxID=1304888 RepID=UPI0003B4C2A4|nr:tyrosine-type recombinase/integrase [Limisalsivibrio acetivorans]
MALTDLKIKNAKYSDKDFRLADEKAMYLLIKKSGKYFRLDYKLHGKRKTYAIGVYPETSLKEAREIRDAARKLIKEGIDPVEHRKTLRDSKSFDKAYSFEYIAGEWFIKNKRKWSDDYAKKKWRSIEKNLLPYIASKDIRFLEPPELLRVFEKIQNRGAIETAHRAKGICSEIFRYAIAVGKAKRDPTQDLKGALIPTTSKNMATITDTKQIGELLRAIDGYQGEIITRFALMLLPLVFVRPGELRHAEWNELDISEKIWKIPAEKMKTKRPHIVPLSSQAISIIEELQMHTGRWKYLFPSMRSKERPISNNTINAALRRMGYSKDDMTGHGFRAMASTSLYENGWSGDCIERQLAHVENNTVKAAYNYAQHLDERARMMQWWADYLDKLKGV